MLSLALWGTACATHSDSDSTLPPIVDAGEDGGRDGSNGTKPRCYAAIAGVPATIEDPEEGSSYSAFAWSGDGVVAVAPRLGGLGYLVVELRLNGAVQGPIQTLWPEDPPATDLRLAVSGDMLAIVDQAVEEESHRPVCRLGIAQLADVATIRPLSRFSDPPEPESVLNEVDACDVTAVDAGFLVVWHQVTSSTSDESSLFAQRFDLRGIQMGNRITLAVGDKSAGEYSVTSDGKRAVVTFSATRDAPPELAFIENGEVLSAPLDAQMTDTTGGVTLAPAHGGFLATAGNTLSTLDSGGRLMQGPVNIGAPALVAPLDEGYVVVSHEEYLIARTLDDELGTRSEPTAISDDRSAHGSLLVYAPDGSDVGLIYEDAGQTRLARLECADATPPPPGPPSCPAQTEASPLDDGCSDPVCHAIVRLDYLTLGLRGWAVRGGAASPVDSEAAANAARAVFDENDVYPSGTTLGGPEAGLYTAYVDPSDFGAFALVGEQSGLVVAAGGIVWSGTGYYWVPTSWNDPNELACGAQAVVPTTSYLDPGGCGTENEAVNTAAAGEALDVVMHSNLAQHFASEGPFSAFTYLYTPTVGECSPEQAEYLVVLTRAK